MAEHAPCLQDCHAYMHLHLLPSTHVRYLLSSTMSETVFTFAAIADPQYANQEDAYIEGRNQRYREVPGKLRSAVAEINSHGQVAFTLTLGDIVDGSLEEDLQTLTDIFAELSTPVHHVVGNHDLAVTRSRFLDSLKIPSSFYSTSVAPGWRLLVLDTTDM